jgi:hypothetical protein
MAEFSEEIAVQISMKDEPFVYFSITILLGHHYSETLVQ